MHIRDIQASGNVFIDENHFGLLSRLDHLTETLRADWSEAKFSDGVKEFIFAIENHFLHEETILKGAAFKELDAHSLLHRRIVLHLRESSLDGFDYDNAVDFIARARTRIFTHELFEDQDYWPVFESPSANKDPLIVWSSDIETGDAETDKHHKALINHINRLHERFKISTDVAAASAELQTLYAYSEFHFSEEESLLGGALNPRHRANHWTLLSGLRAMTNEVEAGEYNLENIGDYLKYWLLNHIQTFDVPDFRTPE